MKYKLEYNPRLTEKKLFKKLHIASKAYEPYLDRSILFIFRTNKDSEYAYYSAFFGKRNFMHLAGIKSKSLNADSFFDCCLLEKITKADCTPRKDPVTMYAKIDIMKDMFDFKHSKCYKIGEKTVITADNQFEFATGNNIGLVGYDHRINIAGTDIIDKNKPVIPTTLIRKPIYDYCSQPEKIMFVLALNQTSCKYSDIIYEIKDGLFEKEKELFPDPLKNLVK